MGIACGGAYVNRVGCGWIEQRVRGDDSSPCVGRIEAHREGHRRLDGDCVLECGGVHLAREIDGDIRRKIHIALEIGRGRSNETGRAFGGEGPMVSERVGIACYVFVATLQHHLICRARLKGGVPVLELPRAEPDHGSGGGGQQRQPACH